ncbi:MAG: trigger factor [Vibrionaceae bacterium]
MQVIVEATEGLERHLTITVPGTNVNAAVDAELRNIAKNRRFDGFRKGKVPLKMVEKIYGKSVRQDILGDVMQSHFFAAISQEKINPAGMPTFTPITVEDGSDLIFKASFEVFPKIELKDLEQIEVTKVDASINDADVDNMLETLRKQQATWEEAAQAAQVENRVTIDFVGSIAGEEFEGGKASGFALVLGQGRMIPGFEDNIIGKKAGDEFTVDVTFPEDYHAEKLKGQAAQFAITLHKVEVQVLPELTNEFVQRFGINDGTVEGLKAEVRRNMERELKANLKNRIKEQVLDGLVKTNDILVPSALVDQEVEVLRQQAMQRFGGGAKTQPQLPRELFEEQATRRVKVGLLLGEAIRSFELQPDEMRVNALIEDMSTAYETPEEVISYYQQDKRAMENMRNVALEEQAIEAILEKAKVSHSELSFSEVMTPAQA